MCRKPSPRKRNLLKRSPQRIRHYESHVLICTGSDCKKRGAKETRKAIKSEIRLESILGEVRLDTVDCLGFCKYGPNAIIYDGTDPKGTWHLGLDESEAP